jgi:hypothetical protein
MEKEDHVGRIVVTEFVSLDASRDASSNCFAFGTRSHVRNGQMWGLTRDV